MISLYQFVNYGGQSANLSGDVRTLHVSGNGDFYNSCKVTDGMWILFEDTDYQGVSSVIGAGSYPTPEAMGIKANSLSSMRELPEPLGKPLIVFFADSEYRGGMAGVYTPSTNFKSFSFNDCASSIIVVSGTWQLFKDADYTGQMWTLGPGRYPTPAAAGISNDSISSARPI